MPLTPITGPALEPVSLQEAKDHLRVDLADEDVLIASLISAARIHIEQWLSRALITQSWSYIADAWPADLTVTLPIAPVQVVSEVRVIGLNDNIQIIPGSDYFLDAVSDSARLLRRIGAPWPNPGRVANGIEIDFVAGYGAAASDVPQPLRQAVLLLVAHWFERREPVELGSALETVPMTVGGLLAPYRSVRL